MKNILLTITSLFFCPIIVAQTFDYDSSYRRILVRPPDLTGSLITTYSNNDYWKFKDEVITDPGTFSGALQISSLSDDAICASSYVWNNILGSYPSGGDAQTSVASSFSLATETKFKVEFFGAVHVSTYMGYLFIKPHFFLKSGYTGNGGTLLHFDGSGVDYITVPAGDYQITTAVGASYTCSNDSACIANISGQSSLSLIPVNLSAILGESFNTPFSPDNYTETQSPDVMSENSYGAFIIRGENSYYTYLDEVEGWFDIGGENQAYIDMQSSHIVTELQLPGNREGDFNINVGNVHLGEFSANEVIVFADHSTILGSLLLSGAAGLLGVANIEINYLPLSGENITNLCGSTSHASVKLKFDENQVAFDVVIPYTNDFIFKEGFEE